jgi:hypothetical protein
MLLLRGAFPRGVAVLRLRGGDGADHRTKRLHHLYWLAQAKAVTDPTLLDSAILDENSVPAGEPDVVSPPRHDTGSPSQDVAIINDVLGDSDYLEELDDEDIPF